MGQCVKLNREAAKRPLRIRPGGMLIIRPSLLRKLGGDPAQLMANIEGGQIVISRRHSLKEARLCRLKGSSQKTENKAR